MAHEAKQGLWATDDGSFGEGSIVVVDTSKWTKKQWAWYERLSDAGDVYAEDLQNIDNKIKPDFN
jgi:hypothetical protein